MSHQHCLFYLFLMVALAKSCQCVVCRPIVLSVTFYGVFEVTTIFIIISEYYLPFLVLTSAVMVQKQWWVNFWHLSTSRGWDAKLLAVTVFFTALDTHFKVFWMLKLKVCRKQSCCVLWRFSLWLAGTWTISSPVRALGFLAHYSFMFLPQRKVFLNVCM